ncbi:MAG: hypothetical protein EXR71_03230 [Myxococcales bacterium]|nr:hypothetical protein [Myxococcales bacterium]
MRVVCDNCGASYKIPDSKLTQKVNKATCRKCGNPIIISRPDAAPAPGPSAEELADERTLISTPADLERQVRSRTAAPSDDGSADPRPTQISPDNSGAEMTVPRESASVLDEPPPPSGDAPTIASVEPAPPPAYTPARAAPAVAPSRQVVGTLPPPTAAPPPPPLSATPQRIAAAYDAAAAGPPPRPPPRSADKPPYDPRGDLTFAALLALLGMGGALLNLVSAALDFSAIGAVGTFITVFGSAGTVLVILTGGRGTRPASIVLGGAGGFFLATILGIAHFLACGGIAGIVADGPPALVRSTPTPVAVPPPTPVPVPVPVPRVEPAPLVEPVVTPTPPAAPPALLSAPTAPIAFEFPEPKPVAPKPAEPKRTPERIPAKPTEAARPKPPPAAEEGRTLPVSVIDTMMKTNKGVKICYIKENKASGEMPSNVRLKMTIQPSGSVSSAKIPSGDWKGTDFDSCLSAAAQAIVFPEFDGEALSMTYAFPNF